MGLKIEYCGNSRGLVTSIGYGGNGEAYTTLFDTLFDRFTLFVYDSFGYPSDIYDLSSDSKSKVRLVCFFFF